MANRVARRSRRAEEPNGALVAAAQRVDLRAKASGNLKRQSWQADAWAVYDDVTEVKQLVQWRANQIGKLRLIVACRPDDDPDAEPVAVTDDAARIPPAAAAAAGEVLRRLRARIGGQSEILRKLEINLEVAAEAYIVGFAERVPASPDDDGQPEEWMCCSIDEIERKSGTPAKWMVKPDPDDKSQNRELDSGAGDDIFRVWQPHGRWQNRPDCSMRGMLTDCETLLLLASQLQAEAKSRAFAGFLCVPSELSIAQTSPTVDGDDAKPDADKFMSQLLEAITAVVENPGSAESVVPLLLRGPAEALKAESLRHLTISRQSDGVIDERIEALVRRVARGLNAPPERVMGHQQTTFANAKQVSRDEWEQYLEPRAQFDVEILTIGYLQPMLAKAGVDPALVDRMFVWYDESDLVAQPDLAAEAEGAYDRTEISGATYRRVKGFDEGDAPDMVEKLIRLAFQRGPIGANVTNALLEAVESGEVVFPLPDPVGGGGAPAAGQMALLARLLLAASATAGGGSNGNGSDGHGPQVLEAAARPKPLSGTAAGRRLAAIDRDLRTRLLVAANEAMSRALEKAGNRLRARAGDIRARLRNTEPRRCAATLGRSVVADAGFTDSDLLAGAFDALEADYLAWGAAAQDQAVEVANRLVGGFTQAQRDQLGLRLSGSLSESWEWMREALTSLAHARLYDPAPAAPAAGEFDPTLSVPPGLVRQAVARAGGAAGLESSGGDVWVAMVDGGARPAGGIATGDVLRDAMRDQGVFVGGYVWDYGPAARARPFEPHVALDGVEFANFDDPVLANGEGWPEFAFYMPGDHEGCQCDASPVMSSGDGD